MSYTALYRKWRPSSFKDVIGQEHLVQTIKNQIKSERIAHAYLFCGTRGTGKTSTAKIFAKAVNCLAPEDGEPCNKCDMCNLINSRQSMNIIEIDAASNNGVDNIREIREEVKYAPTEGRYKVYIIDEVHMLSTGAFNALLKTLEEPPAHVIFILATTEPHKIPATILSRCQRYDLKRISINEISNTLKIYMEKENIQVEEKAIRYIAKMADGSMRDALSILDQCISFYIGTDVTLDKVLDVLGAVDNEIFFKITEYIYNEQARSCIEVIDEIMTQGRDISQFVLDLIMHMRNLLILQASEGENILDMSEENIQALREQAEIISSSTLTRYIKTLSTLETQLKYASQKRIILEVALIKLCQPDIEQSYDAIIDRLNKVETKLKQGIQVVHTAQGQGHQQPVKKKPIRKPKAVANEVKTLCKKWPSIKERLKKITPSNVGLLEQVFAGYLEGDILYLVCPNDIIVKIISSEEKFNSIKHTIEELEGREYHIKIIDEPNYNRQHEEFYGDEGYQESSESSLEEDIQKMMNIIPDEIPVEIE